jgi:RHS repeat-associated protein
VAKTDSTGQFALVSDGTAPASPVLADGLTVFTPGLSSRRNGASQFRHGDLLGSLRFETDASQNVTANRLYSAFGSTVASAGDPLLAFGWVGDGESQTDADTGLVLMGHRLYDSRIGRFLTQDPAGAGNNWYAYADNDPVDNTDPEGLWVPQNGEWSVNGGAMSDATSAMGQADAMDQQADRFIEAAWTQLSDNVMAIAAGPHHPVNERQPGESNLHYFLRGLKWAVEQAFTTGPDPGTLGAQGSGGYEADKSRWGTGKAPWQVQPGIRSIKGQYTDKTTGRIEPWEAHYDQYGRQTGRTDYNAGNKADNTPDTHYHTYGYRNGIRYPIDDHAPGVLAP